MKSIAARTQEQERIVRLHRDGLREEAMRLFVKLYQERLYSIAYRMLLNHDDALDAAQEALIQADRSLPSFRGDSALDTWVFRLATNVCLSYCRKNASRRTIRDPWDSRQIIENLHARRESEPEVVCETMAKKKMIEAALQGIPVHMRILVVLHDLEDMTVPQIAGIVQKHPAAVKSSLHRARGALRRILSEGIQVPGEEAVGRLRMQAGELV